MKINGKTITPERLIEIAMPRHAKQIKDYMRSQKPTGKTNEESKEAK